MRSGRTIALAVLLSALVFPPPGPSQTRSGRNIYGEFRVDESKVRGSIPQSFQVVLYSSAGHAVARQSVSNNGRYRFFNVPRGDYNIVVEVAGEEVLRIPIVLQEILTEQLTTDIRKDILLQWNPVAAQAPGRGEAVVPLDALYDRTAANQKLFDAAREAAENKRLRQAEESFRKVAETDPGDFQAWTELGTVLFRQNKHSDAEKALQRAVTARPSYFLAWMNLGKLRVDRKNWDGAIEALSRALEIQPESAETNFLLGESHLQIRKGSRAVGYLEEAVRLDPVGQAEAHLRLAALYNAAGLKERAAAEYEQFLEKVPDHPARGELRRYISQHRKKP